ncbi:MAG: RDD family protein [Saprospiraceae bacterium]|nr:RDD family protein [Saprospiraceae bacterium]MBL0101955.1 RDD family protein [Saprospiraceae bacterium]
MAKSSTYIVTHDTLAGSGVRFLNYLIDSLAILLALLFLFVIYFAFVAEISPEEYDLSLEETGNDVVINILSIVLMAVYYFLFESSIGRTPGKYVTGTVVVDRNGNIPSATQVLQRTLSRFIPFEFLSFLGRDARGWHDNISDTYVVYVKKLEDSKSTFTNMNELGSL